MPNYYAHLTLGRRALEGLPAEMRETVEREREAFDLGCLGPDPLFFALSGPVRREGLDLHRCSAMPAFRRLRAAMEEQVPMAWGYAAGFLCHLALDHAGHSWLDRQAAAGPATHLGMEAEFDRALMAADGLDPLARSYLPPMTDRAAFQAAACAFPRADAGQVEAGCRAMARDVALIHRLHGTRLGRAVTWTSGRLKPLQNTKGMILDVEIDKKYTKSNQILGAILEETAPLAAHQITALFQAVRQGTPLPGWLDRDFQGNRPRSERALDHLAGLVPPGLPAGR